MSFINTSNSDTILVVDDEKINLTILEHSLSAYGYNVIQAQSGKGCLDILEADIPDLILLDIRLPDIDGYTICRQIRENKRLDNVSIIFLSALEDQQYKQAGFNAGAQDFISKPFEMGEVLARIKFHIANKKNLSNLELSKSELHSNLDKMKQQYEDKLRIEEQLKEQQILFQKAQKLSKTGHWVYDLSSSKFTISKSLLDIIGIQECDLENNSLNYLASLIHPEDLQQVREWYKSITSHECITENRSLSFEIRILHNNNGQVKYLWIEKFEEICDVSNKLIKRIGIIQDITIHKKHNLDFEIINIQYLQVQKIVKSCELVSEFVSEINNLTKELNTHISNCTFESDNKESSIYSDMSILVNKIRMQLCKMAVLSDGVPYCFKPENVFSIIENSTNLLLHDSEINYIVSSDDISRIAFAQIDKFQIEIAFMNIILNARQALTANKGLKSIQISLQSVQTKGSNSQGIRISVRDNGPGIDNKYLERVFDPFFSLKENHKGLGLSLCKTIVQKHNGSVIIQSEMNSYTEVSITLPVVEEKQPHSLLLSSNHKGTGHFLIIDPNKDSQYALSAMLQQIGYTTVHLSNYYDFTVFTEKNNIEKITGMIIKITSLEDISGIDLIQLFLEKKPSYPVFAICSCTSVIIKSVLIDTGFTDCIQQPVNLTELSEMLNRFYSKN